jgi:glycosyltransferase involved in cell wall biosynthesis
MVTSCGVLVRSSLARRTELHLLDSTQVSNPPPNLLVRLARAVPRFAQFIAQVERCRPDAVVLFAAVDASLLEKGTMAWYARLRGVPAILFPRGGALIDSCEASGLTRRWVRVAFSGARKVFCQSPRWQRFAHDVLHFDPSDAPVIPNWTATEELLAIGRRRLAQPAPDRVRLLFVGWLDRAKGIAELLAACRALAPELRFTLDLVGEGNMSVSAREIVSRDGLSDRVRFRGWLQGADLAAAFEGADVFVLPSWAEGMPNAMIEAMSARLAVVVTSVGGVPDVVADGVHGLLVPPRDQSALSSALGRIIRDAELRRRLAGAGHTLAATRFDAERAVDLMVREFSALQSGA